jgi:RNA polymerase sigma factor (sigma-70 family)
MDPQRPTKAACDLFDDLMQLAQAVRERIICGNLRLVISIAKNCKSVDLTFDELCSEGVFALMRAVDCFNIDRGFRFSTYAYTAIARAVHREAGEARIRGQRQINGVPTSTLERFEEMDAEATINEDSLGRSGELLRKLMGGLNPREQLVINARYGIDRDQPQLTFQRLGEILGVSKERVRQIEARALRELKRMAQELALHHFPESLIEGPAS